MFGFIKKDSKKQEVKNVILKEYFNSVNQKKVITQAAKESAKDQNILLSRYNKLMHS